MRCASWAFVALILFAGPACAMVVHQAWSEQDWCESVREPLWPFAYDKDGSQIREGKGRTARNLKNLGHVCQTRGVESKCHFCKQFYCGEAQASECSMQVQGVQWSSLRGNIPVVSDTPWAVGGSHRHDFGGGSHVCVITSSGRCVETDRLIGFDFSNCKTRCWGSGQGPPIPSAGNGDSKETTWSWPEGSRTLRPQGRAWVFAGSDSGEAGHVDGPAADARFREPSDVAIDQARNAYVADSGNHCIRRIDGLTGEVVTIAGTPGVAGFKDGPVESSLFDTPISVALYHDNSVKTDPRSGDTISNGFGEMVLLVSDSNNHKIRKILFPTGMTSLAELEVETLTGRLGQEPSPGFADGDSREARLDTPRGIAADLDGVIYVADSHNHVIREVQPNGDVRTLAGRLTPRLKENSDSCPHPCLRGEPGQSDGNLTHAKFFFPSHISLGPEHTLLVADGNRVAMVTKRDTISRVEGETLENRVLTFAGNLGWGTGDRVEQKDGIGNHAAFGDPAGITFDSNTGRIYVSETSTCRLRRLSTSSHVSRPLTCENRLDEMIWSSGCYSYEPPVDSLLRKHSDVEGNMIHEDRKIHKCQGSPPGKDGIQSDGKTMGSRLDTGHEAFAENEDTDAGAVFFFSCPAGCLVVASASVSGENTQTQGYTDDSSICRAAIHAGVIDNSDGGLVKLTVLPGTTSDIPSVLQNSVAGIGRTGGWRRNFHLEKHFLNATHVSTFAGIPAAPLETSCGLPSAHGEYRIPERAKFNRPLGIAIGHGVSLTNQGGREFLYVADAANHAIQALTASCARICENGGECIADEQCSCVSGWSGDDCSVPICSISCPGTRQVCVAPDTCDCVPGYSGFPGCTVALCVQNCENGGICSAPDTCTCAAGWIDPNCTTPVCDQTCGNSGNCTAPDSCTCTEDWTGIDCRTPICRQTCQNGGHCVAPDTCLCPPEYSGHDCSLPVCWQGFLEADSENSTFPEVAQRITDASLRPGALTTEEAIGIVWRQSEPCDDSFAENWCNSTNGFDCHQKARKKTLMGASCIRIELALGAITPFPYEMESSSTSLTGLWRRTPSTPYGWNAAFVPGPDDALSSDWESKLNNWRAPDATAMSDRMVAHVKEMFVTQGRYVCANGGACSAPNVCVCASGWSGFDCRTPVCENGYYVPPSETNPGFVEFEGGNLVAEKFPGQGLYECSIRAFTEWENPSYMHQHPNFYSRYMDHHVDEWSPSNRFQLEPESPYYWTGMSWPATYVHTDPEGNHTNKGWRRNGIWQRIIGTEWMKGECEVEFDRVCPRDPSKAIDVRTLLPSEPLEDTEAAFRPVVTFNDSREEGVGRWFESGGECVDRVLWGCKNNGTCVGPSTCECAQGWAGPDCTIPVCEETCSRPADEDLGVDSNGHKIFSRGTGNCTLPDVCTCELGWTGPKCAEPLCAQECNNKGICTAPDTCSCARWRNTWRDRRLDGGRPLFQDQNGDPQLTGWTGYDCSTPICTQAEEFVLNDVIGSIRLGGYGLILFGHEPFNNLRRDDLTMPPYMPYTFSNDVPPIRYWIPEIRDHNSELWSLPEKFLEEDSRLCRMQGLQFCTDHPDASPLQAIWSPGDGEVVRNDGRSYQSGCKKESGRFSDAEQGVSVGYLCNVLAWEQGDYSEGRYSRRSSDSTAYIKNSSKAYLDLSVIPQWEPEGDILPGEGVYKCANFGSCVAPDVCSCPDGFTGFDCRESLCRHKLPNHEIVSCLNEGICKGRDNCTCKKWESTITPGHQTGFQGSACQVPVCTQGIFDETCDEVDPGSEGCFRCLNGGLCTAPDTCKCPPKWTGIDCGTPICRIRADDQIIEELQTSSAEKIRKFELDPCMHSSTFMHDGYKTFQGNCSAPNTCSCFCAREVTEGETTYHHSFGKMPPFGFTESTGSCIEGFEGLKDPVTGAFRTCHLRIYIPMWYEQYAKTLIVAAGFVLVFTCLAYVQIKRRMRQRYLMARAEQRLTLENDETRRRRKTRRNLEARKKKRRTERKVA